MELLGRVASGFGEGRKFFSLSGYAGSFEKLLGKKPFPGTLNLDVGIGGEQIAAEARESAQIAVPGFKLAGKKYFGVKCARAKVRGVGGLLVFPEKNFHPKNIIEFVCSEDLRKKFGLKDGDEVKVEIGTGTG
jgi:riboflavin kinase